MDDPVDIWQNQPVEPLTMSMEEIRNKAVKFERRIRSRNLRETVIAVALIPLFVLFLRWFPAPLARAGSVLNIAALVYVIWRMNGSAAPSRVPDGAGWENCIAFHRRELARHRDLLRTVWRWYLGPLVPGVVLFNFAIIAPKVRAGHPADWWRVLPSLALLIAWFIVVVRLNNRAADCLQRRIDELDRVAGQ